MDSDSKKRLIVTSGVLLLVVVARVGYLVYERRDPGVTRPVQQSYSANPDDYVHQHKFYGYDLKSAQHEMVDKSIWVRAGNQIPYYRYDAKSHSISFAHEAGLLLPIEKLNVQDVMLQKAPTAIKPGEVAISKKQIMIVFHRDNESTAYAASVGTVVGDTYSFETNEILFSEDPRILYKHWPPEVWSAIDRHEAREGMNELQASFALGTDMSVGAGEYGNRVVEFSNAGKPVAVTFAGNHAIKVVQQKSQ